MWYADYNPQYAGTRAMIAEGVFDWITLFVTKKSFQFPGYANPSRIVIAVQPNDIAELEALLMAKMILMLMIKNSMNIDEAEFFARSAISAHMGSAGDLANNFIGETEIFKANSCDHTAKYHQ